MDKSLEKFLAPGEKVVEVMNYSKAQFIWELVWGFVLLIVIAGLYFIFRAIYRLITIKYIVTDQRVIIKRGLIGQSTQSLSYSKITDVHVEQGILGRILLHTGTITLDSAGNTPEGEEEMELEWVDDPFKTKDIIYQHLHKK